MVKVNIQIIVFVFLYLGVAPWAIASKPSFSITSNCLTSIEVGEASYAPLVKLSITLDEEAANKMLSFSKKNLKKEVVVIDGAGNVLSEVRIMTPISNPFVIVGLESESKAKEMVKKLTSSNGTCG